MANNKVLLISLVFYPDEVAVANLFTNLCSVLSQSGMEIEVWCSQPNYTSRAKQPKIAYYNGVEIHYLNSITPSKDRLFGRLVYYISFSIAVVFKLLFSQNRSTVISHTTPPFLAILVSFVCKFRLRRFIYVLMDVFPDGLIRLKKASPLNPFIRVWQFLHVAALKRSSAIVVIGRDMRDWLCTIYPGGITKIKYIPLWQDEELLKPMEFCDNKFVKELNLEEFFVVQYSGNMGLWNAMETIGEAVNKMPDVKFLIIGDGMRKGELLGSIDDETSNILLLPFQPNDKYAQTVTACHVALVSLREGLEGMAVPSKIIGIMGAGIPVIALVPEQSEIAYIIEEEQCGIVVSPSDSDGLVVAISKLQTDENLRRRLGQNGREAFLKKYTSRIIAENYKSLLTV